MPAVLTLVLASANSKKAAEIQALLPGWSLRSLNDIGFREAIPEPFDRFEDNARNKAEVVHAACGLPVLADDSGLCVDALGGAPGVYSARYAGEPSDDVRNWQKLLRDLDGVADRRAHFVAVMCVVGLGGAPQFFRGTCHGQIALEPSGSNGFGYDPVFIPDGYTQTMAALSASEKARISHRAAALQALRHAFAHPPSSDTP